MIFLIKPQFESQREMVGKHGVIRDAEVHKEILNHVIHSLRTKGIYLKALEYSPIKGAKGNIEFLAYFVLSPVLDEQTVEGLIDHCVENAHEDLS
jgi:23S rRNA (cytidine1920-2'-O)/16S rRNA (cytidine1409-2'-O)-methyltransferase